MFVSVGIFIFYLLDFLDVAAKVLLPLLQSTEFSVEREYLITFFMC